MITSIYLALLLFFMPAGILQNTGQDVARTISLQDTLPMDPAIISGKLNNGLVYYIRQNHKPEKRAELRLVVNAGSILEKNDQQGLAHVLEHMAFNGTEHFARQDLINYLQWQEQRTG